MTNYLGDFAEDSTIYIPPFTTVAGAGGLVAPLSAFEAADLVIYKDNGASQKTSANGVTMTSPFDSVVGVHAVTIDTSNDTGDTGFWVAGADYSVMLLPDETVDGQTVGACIATFSIENRGSLRYRRSVEGIIIAVVGTGSTLTDIVLSSVSPALVVTDQFKGKNVYFPNSTTTAALKGQATDITGCIVAGQHLTVTALTTAPVNGDLIIIS